MKKLLITVLVGAAAYASYGQGTIAMQNTPATLINTNRDASNPGQARGLVPTTAGLLYYGVFAVPTNGFAPTDVALISNAMTLATAPGRVVGNSTGTAGGFAGPAPATVYALDYAAGTALYIQIRAWDARSGNASADSYRDSINKLGYLYGVSLIKPFVLAGASGPGTTIMGGTASRIPSFDVYVQVPEPSTIALVGVGLAGLLFLRRRK